MLDRAARGVHQPGTPTPTGPPAASPTSRAQRLDDLGRGGDDASAPRTVGRRTDARHDAVGRRPRRPGSWSRRCRARSPARHRSHPAERSSSRTAATAGRDEPRVQIRGDRAVVRPGQPHSTTTTGRPASSAASRAPTSGWRCASRTWTTSGPSAAGDGASSRRDRRQPSAGRPHAASPTAMLARPATLTTSGAAQVGQHALHRDGPPGAGQLVGRRRRRFRRARRRSASDPLGGLDEASLRQPARPDGRHDGGLDLAHQRRRPCRRPGTAGRRRRPGRAPRPPGCRVRRGAGHVEGVGDDGAVEAQRARAAAPGPAGSGSPGDRGRAPARGGGTSSPRRRRPRPRPRTAPARARPGRRRLASTRRQGEVAVLGGVAVAGEVLDAGRRPRPPAGRAARPPRGRPTRRGRRRRLRAPITGLSGLLLTSATGARSRSMPAAASSAPTSAAGVAGQVEVVDGSERGGAEDRAAAARVQPGDVAALLVDRDHRSRGGPVDGVVSAATASGPSAVLEPNRQTPPSPSASRSATSGASVVPGKAGSCTPQRELLESTGHPFTAPAVRPATIRPWTIEEEDDHRDRDERRAGHDRAPVGAAVDAR